jgi:hypothetical protein
MQVLKLVIIWYNNGVVISSSEGHSEGSKLKLKVLTVTCLSRVLTVDPSNNPPDIPSNATDETMHAPTYLVSAYRLFMQQSRDLALPRWTVQYSYSEDGASGSLRLQRVRVVVRTMALDVGWFSGQIEGPRRPVQSRVIQGSISWLTNGWCMGRVFLGFSAPSQAILSLCASGQGAVWGAVVG